MQLDVEFYIQYQSTYEKKIIQDCKEEYNSVPEYFGLIHVLSIIR